MGTAPLERWDGTLRGPALEGATLECLLNKFGNFESLVPMGFENKGQKHQAGWRGAEGVC